MCECAAGAINCMSRPGVADLRCSDCGCCDASALTLDDIDAETLDWFDAGAEAGGAGETVDAEELALMADYASAIEVAWERVTSRVCMARYVGECILTVTLCTPASAARAVCRCTDGTCPAGLFIPELSDQVHPSRIGAVTSGGDPVSLDGSNPSASWALTTHDGYRLHGPIPASLTIQTRDPGALFVEAVESLACKLVPGVHGSECAIGGGVALLSPGDGSDPFGDPFADSLSRECCGAGGWVGRASAVVSFNWGPGGWVPGVCGPGHASESFANLALWAMTHSLGYHPAVTAVDAAGRRILPDVDYVSLNEIHVTHAVPTTGTVYLS